MKIYVISYATSRELIPYAYPTLDAAQAVVDGRTGMVNKRIKYNSHGTVWTTVIF